MGAKNAKRKSVLSSNQEDILMGTDFDYFRREKYDLSMFNRAPGRISSTKLQPGSRFKILRWILLRQEVWRRATVGVIIPPDSHGLRLKR